MTLENFKKAIYAANGNDEKILALFTEGNFEDFETEINEYKTEFVLNAFNEAGELKISVTTKK